MVALLLVLEPQTLSEYSSSFDLCRTSARKTKRLACISPTPPAIDRSCDQAGQEDMQQIIITTHGPDTV